MNRDREHQNFSSGRMLVFWLFPIFFLVSSLLLWYYHLLFMACHSSVCGHSSLQMRLSAYFSIQFTILPFLGSYVNLIALIMIAEIYPVFRYVHRSLLKACKKKHLFMSWSSCFQSGSNCLYKWLIIQASMIEYFFSFSSLFSAFRDWKQPWPSSTLR